MSEPIASRQRRVIHFSGRVQGVGFRYTTRSIARRFDVSGWVQNLPDGRVLLVVEGEPQSLEQLVHDIQAEMAGHIGGVEISTQPATGEFASFDVRR